jgi:hypothetical protein
MSYTWTYTVKETDNVGYNLWATAKDVAGNAATAAATVSVTLDGAVPVVTNVATDRAKYSKVGGYNRVTLTFDCAEGVGMGLSVKVGGQAMACDAYSATPPSYTCRYDIQAGDTAGIKDIAVQAADAAGNTGFGSGSVEYDFGSPAVTTSSASPSPAGLGKALVYTLNASEPLSASPVLHLTPSVSLSGPTQSGTLYTWTRNIDGTETQGAFSVTVDLTDTVGNISAGLPVSGFTVDTLAPGVLPLSVTTDNPRSNALATNLQTTTAVFMASEGLSADPLVTLGGKGMTFVSKTGTGPWTYTYSRTAVAGDMDGLKVATVTATDLAGNVTVQDIGSVTYDFTAPTVTASAAGPDPAGMGKALTYTVTASEELSETPSLRFAPVLAMQGPVQSGTQFAWTRTVNGSETQGIYTAAVDLIDAAGNLRSAAPAAGFSIDWSAPAVNQVSLTTNNPNFNNLAKDGEVVTAVFTINEDPPANPTVTIGGAAMDFVSKTGSGPYTFTYNRTAASGDLDGVKGVTVSTADAAGNATVYNFTSTVTYDFILPYVIEPVVAVQISGPAGSLVPATAVTFGGTARILFTVNEELFGPPFLQLAPSDGNWTITPNNAGNYHFIDAYLTGGSPTQGLRGAAVILTDRAGNTTSPLVLVMPPQQLMVDTVAPTPITVEQNDRILYRRIPWGSDATSGVKTFTVGTTAACGPGTGAVEPDSTVVFWDDDDIATAAEIGRKTADGNGCFAEKELNRADRVNVYLTQVDSAGNVDSTTATAIRNTEWTATMGYKVAGNTFDNPNVFTSTGIFTTWLAQNPEFNYEPAAADLAKVARVDANAMIRAAEASWNELPFNLTRPSARDGHAMAYDSGRGKVVLFGGSDDGVYDDETWEWDGTMGIWTQRTPVVKPSARYGHAMGYDSGRGKVVLFGGSDGALDGETWEWDGAAGTWTQRTPAVKPSVRVDHAMAYDSGRGKVVLFGGDDGAYDDETWEWDGAAGTWTQRTSAVKPSARRWHAMAYDSGQGKVVLFGGYDAVGRDDETWEWDGAAGTWTQRTPAVKPSARILHAMGYDSGRGKVVLFGGSDGALDDETWEWDGAAGTWTQRTPAVKPSARYGHAMGYDGARGKVLLFGGYDGARDDETWEWDGAAGTWTQWTPAVRPSARYQHAMAYDSGRGKVVLFGGSDGALDDETWEWDGVAGTWTQRTPAVKPSARIWHAMAYDVAPGKVVLFGGNDGTYDDETWEWDGAAGTWTQRTPAVKPSARYGHAMAYDGARGKVLFFGGYDGAYDDETWEWDGATGTWTQRAPAVRPSARYRHAVAYDSGRGKVFLFGGSDGALDKTWEWDGGAAEKPGKIIEAVFGVAGLSATPALKSVSSTFYAGGAGYPSGFATNGVDLKVWDEGMWKIVATNNAAPGNPQLVSWTTTDAQVISRLFFGDQQTLNFAVTPVAPNGTGVGEVSVDYVEVVVKYRQP